MVRDLGAPGDPQSRSAILMGYVDRKPYDVKVTFDAAVFPEVVRAFHDRLMICCKGDLMREGGSFLLKNPRYFRILEAAGSR